MEICLDGSNVGTSLVVAFRPPFKRLNDSFRRTGSQRLGRRPASLVAPPEPSQCEQNGQIKCNDPDGPAVWATSFEKLLDDPLGLHTFAEFLKKEFSAENIYFWTACERYRRLPPGADRRAEAQRIYQQHLCVGAPEPVNVDAQARQCTEQALCEADDTLFSHAQKQIFNLMKFDSYPRFLKSTLYKECLAGVMDRVEVDVGLMLQPQQAAVKLKKSLSNAEDRRRKSLLPWHRKNRSKSKDRGESEYIQQKMNVEGGELHSEADSGRKGGAGDMHSSKSSLTSLDLAVSTAKESIKSSQEDLVQARIALCRVILSNGSTTVVQIKDSETIQQLVKRLLEKRGLVYSSFEVYTDKHSKAVDVNEPSTKLAGCEVTVEQRVAFKLDLPNYKVISVKSKYTKMIVDVLRPILHKYNYNLDQVKVTVAENELLNLNQQVTAIDNARLNIQLCDDTPNHHHPSSTNSTCTKNSNNLKPNKLDEITNQVFEGILMEKADSVMSKARSDKGSVKSEDWGSEHSSGIFGRFLRRDSAMHEKKKKLLMSRGKGGSNEGHDDAGSEHGQVKKPLIAKWKAGVNKLQVTCSESDELVEGLTRAQRARLEDQRGTEINFELPDFLKDKENDRTLPKQPTRRPADVESARFYTADASLHAKPECAPTIASSKNLKLEPSPIGNYENTVIKSTPTPTNNSSGASPESSQRANQQSKVHNLRSYPSTKFPSPMKDSTGGVGEGLRIEPPPLPPKPKIIPIKPSNWGNNGFHRPNKNTVFLEQPSSSFV